MSIGASRTSRSTRQRPTRRISRGNSVSDILSILGIVLLIRNPPAIFGIDVVYGYLAMVLS
jgi:hypothetical protein